MPLLAVDQVVFGRRLKRRSIECKEVDADFTTVIQRSIAWIGLVQAFGREADEFGRFHALRGRQRPRMLAVNWQEVVYSLIVGLLSAWAGP